jgi:hypothetical protein
MHHDHLHIVERQPLSGGHGLEHQLYHLPRVEVSTDKLPVRRKLLERHDRDMMLSHDGYCVALVELGCCLSRYSLWTAKVGTADSPH